MKPQPLKDTGRAHARQKRPGAAREAWAAFCGLCLALYTAYVVYLPQSGFLKSGAQTIAAVGWYLFFAAALFRLLTLGGKRLARRCPKPGERAQAMDRRFFALTALASLAVLMVALAACYPGGVSYDAANQWKQAQSGEFNNWHPVFHTLLIWLTTRVYNSYWLFVLCQAVCFSAALSYMLTMLKQYGVPVWLLAAVQGTVVLSEPVRNALMYAWKDNAMTIGCLLLCGCGIRLLYTRGTWLRRPRNAAALGLTLAFTTLVRHNAFVFTVPFALLALFAYRAGGRARLVTAGTFALCLLLVQGGLYSALDIVYPDNAAEEAVGIPMMILGNAKLEAPDAIDAETDAFLHTLAPEQTWQTVYRRSEYNAIKFEFPREYMKHTPPAKVLHMALRTAARAPRLAFETVNEATDLVWDVTGRNEGFETVSNSGDLDIALYGSPKLHAVGQALTAVLAAPLDLLPLSWLTRNIGVQTLALLLVTLWALYRSGVGALLFGLPVILYNLATMLVLCGQDARFFQFVMAISLPSIVALLYAPAWTETEGASPCR